MKQRTIALILSLLLTFVIGACAASTDESIPSVASTAIAEAPSVASTVVAKATSPEYPAPDAYPTNGLVPPAGIYQMPVGVDIAWVDFPDYPDNTDFTPLTQGQNPGNCGLDAQQWEICSYMYGWQVSVIAPGNNVGMYIHPADLSTYMVIDSAVSGGETIKTYQSESVAISDGAIVIAVKMTVSAGGYAYQFGYVPQ